MEPRELWERHAVLAQAFCSSDDEVRRTQGLLDEAEARRSRTLAAFAVTVGSDEVVADLLGLDAREVRLARRTVGKDDARAVAKSLLEESARERRPARQPNAPEPDPAQPSAASAAASAPSSAAATASRVRAGVGAATAGRGYPGTFAGSPPAPPVTPADAAAYVPPRPTQQPHTVPPTYTPASEPAWSPALDAVLVNSRHNGVDLSALATELGLDVTILAARAHQLASEPRLHRPPSSDRIGRHRRMTDIPPAPQPDTTTLPRHENPPLPPYEPQTPWTPQQHTAAWAPHDPHAAWAPQPAPVPSPPTWDPSAVTVTQHDWDGILSQWEAASTPHTFIPGQPGS
ncbi:hypothetical protein GCM10010211_27750 [Streptomyces albospinus]|uniref:Uncharacterized protein n=1 Tax=Streptomyces albospinus TaxID=285515 RepID=A0ABQ2V3A1_9ACTN|nr:hypothetical protein [Streptomyces albospinus]GGU61252.1 hypothetical protein GCM10010211_27750 [Streptomyces albospinus]